MGGAIVQSPIFLVFAFVRHLYPLTYCDCDVFKSEVNRHLCKHATVGQGRGNMHVSTAVSFRGRPWEFSGALTTGSEVQNNMN
jgi:hypothetical protein